MWKHEDNQYGKSWKQLRGLIHNFIAIYSF